MKTGILLVNLGSPADSTPKAVGKYLRQFLMDPFVIDLPWPLRFALVNGIIAPFRKYRSAEAYQKIWTQRGSPLVAITEDCAAALSKELGSEFIVATGMRYGSPSIEAGLTQLKYEGVARYLVLPLYPQYAASSTETAAVEARRAAESLQIAKDIRILPPFYDLPAYIESVAATCARALQEFQPDHLLFSYHGLPIRAIRGSCEVSDPCIGTWQICSKVGIGNTQCYRAHCYATTNSIIERLGIKADFYSVGFQSRLTKDWIEPFSDRVLEKLAKAGVKKLLVACPSFVADCLETLEEIKIRANYDFRRAGGKELRLVPSLNTDALWVRALADLFRSQKTAN